MKKAILLILFAAVLNACSTEKIDPDLTKEYVGSWKGDVAVEKGYENSTDWVISKVNDNTVKVVSTYNFVAKDPKYTSRTEVSTVENVSLTSTVANSVTMNTISEITIPGDVIVVKGVGIVNGKVLTVASTGTYKKTGQVVTPANMVFRKQ